VVVANLQTGATASVNPDQQLRSASLYKLFLLQYAFAQMWAGRLDAQEQLTLGQALADANPYTDLVVGTRSSVSCALRTMVEISSNSAADLLEQRLGDDAVNAYLRGLGLQQSYITPDRAYTSAADVAHLLAALALGQTVSPLASSQMLTMLLAQQENDRLPQPLPVGLPVAHKTGELPNLRHDAGIVYAPAGPYLLVALVTDAPDEAAARGAIVDLSEAVYNHFAPEGLPRYLGLVPRLAQEVFRVPDAQGRLPLLLDPRADTVAVGSRGVVQREGGEEIRLRQEVVPDLLDLQRAASEAGVPFWVGAGLQPPNDSTRGKVLPTAFIAPCAMDVPPPPPTTPTPAPSAATPMPTPAPTPVPARVAPQAWLGTVIRVADDASGVPSTADETDNPTVRWLDDNAWQFGFVPGLPESETGSAIGHEPWTFRWVGRQMAAAIQPLTQSETYADQATAVLQQAEEELAAHGRSAGAADAAGGGP
jgi:beta-lactamase class A